MTKQLQNSDSTFHPDAIPQILNSTQVCTFLGISKTTLHNLRKDGFISFLKLGKGKRCVIRYKLDELLEDLSRQKAFILQPENSIQL